MLKGHHLNIENQNMDMVTHFMDLPKDLIPHLTHLLFFNIIHAEGPLFLYIFTEHGYVLIFQGSLRFLKDAKRKSGQTFQSSKDLLIRLMEMS